VAQDPTSAPPAEPRSPLTTKVRPGFSWKGLFAVSVWGASFIATRIALECFTPQALVTIRLLCGAGLLAIILAARGQSTRLDPRDRPVCVLLGLVLAAHLGLQAHGLRFTSAINTGWIIGFIPVSIAVGATLLGQQHLRLAGWGGVALGTAGVLVVTAAEPPGFHQARFGDLLQIASCLTWTVYTLAGAAALKRNGAVRVTAVAMAVAAGAMAVPMLFGGVLHSPLTVAAAVAVAFLGLVCSGVAYALWFSATAAHGPTRIASLLYLEPFVALATATALRSEPVTLNAVVGGLCVLLGVWLVGRGARRPAG
jgi:drug/metabolite transporter (DMT)-like permease